MKNYIFLIFVLFFLSCCTIKKMEGETELSFQIRSCLDSAKKTGNFDVCRALIEQQTSIIQDDRLYKRYEYCKTYKDDSQKFSECWMSLNQR